MNTAHNVKPSILYRYPISSKAPSGRYIQYNPFRLVPRARLLQRHTSRIHGNVNFTTATSRRISNARTPCSAINKAPAIEHCVCISRHRSLVNFRGNNRGCALRSIGFIPSRIYICACYVTRNAWIGRNVRCAVRLVYLASQARGSRLQWEFGNWVLIRAADDCRFANSDWFFFLWPIFAHCILRRGRWKVQVHLICITKTREVFKYTDFLRSNICLLLNRLFKKQHILYQMQMRQCISVLYNHHNPWCFTGYDITPAQIYCPETFFIRKKTAY